MSSKSSRQGNLDLFLMGGNEPVESRCASNFDSDSRPKPRFGSHYTSAPSRAKPSATVRPFHQLQQHPFASNKITSSIGNATSSNVGQRETTQQQQMQSVRSQPNDRNVMSTRTQPAPSNSSTSEQSKSPAANGISFTQPSATAVAAATAVSENDEIDDAALLLAAHDFLETIEEDSSAPALPTPTDDPLATPMTAITSSAPMRPLPSPTGAPSKFSPVGSFARRQELTSSAPSASASVQKRAAGGETRVVKKSSAEWCTSRLRWKGIQYLPQDQPLVELMKGLAAARAADDNGSPRAKRVRTARDALRELREAARLVGGRATRPAPRPPPMPPAPPPAPPRVPDLPPLLARPLNPVTLLITPLLQSDVEQSKPAELPDDQQQQPHDQIGQESTIAAREQPDRRSFAQLVTNMAEFEAVLVRQRTDDGFWQVAHGPVSRSFVEIINSCRLRGLFYSFFSLFLEYNMANECTFKCIFS